MEHDDELPMPPGARHVNDASSPLIGALIGAVGGLLGSWMIVRSNHLLGGCPEDGRSHRDRRDDASPNDSDATISDEPATSQVAGLAGERIVGRRLTEHEKREASPLVHYPFGAVVGAVYGAMAEVAPRTAAAAGIPFGAAVWAGAAELGLPLLGLARDPRTYSRRRHLTSLASHVVYGVTVEAVRRAARGTR